MSIKPDWTSEEIREYFTFRVGLTTTDPNAIYYGELITLYNPNIKRESIEIIPEHSEEEPKKITESELRGLRDLLAPDLTLMMNPSLIKKIKPPDEN